MILYAGQGCISFGTEGHRKTVAKSLLFVSLTFDGAASPLFGAFITEDIFKYQLPNQPTYYKLYNERVERRLCDSARCGFQQP